MSNCNYRVLRHVDENNKEYFQIHEVEYDSNGNPVKATAYGSPASAYTVQDLTNMLTYMTAALTMPVLDGNIFNHKEDLKNTINKTFDLFKG